MLSIPKSEAFYIKTQADVEKATLHLEIFLNYSVCKTQKACTCRRSFQILFTCTSSNIHVYRSSCLPHMHLYCELRI